MSLSFLFIFCVHEFIILFFKFTIVLQAYGPYPLHKAAEQGNTRDLILMLEHGLSPNQTNYDCLTPLHEACIHNKVECAEILINYGAKVYT